MKLILRMLCLAIAIPFFSQCNPPETEGEKPENVQEESTEDFKWETETFGDTKIIRYQIPGFDKLSLDQQKLVYFLVQAGLSGRDIMWDQNYRHNLKIRKAIESIIQNYQGEKSGEDWDNFMLYAKRVWFSNGIHHHYSMNKIMPLFSREYFENLLTETNVNLDPEVVEVIFNPDVDAKKVNLDAQKGLLLGSAVNFYDPDITAKEAEDYYKSIIKKTDTPVEYGLNTKLIRDENGKIAEKQWKVGGMYSDALEKVVYWLEKAAEVAENEQQRKALLLLIEYYQTGDLKKWDEYNIAWVNATEGDVDYINGFVEVYNDPLGYKGSYETIVQITDFDASARMKVVADNVQWFEDNSPIAPEHRKDSVVGISYKVVNVAGEAGDASPSTPIGVNLPNNNWIRSVHGSKSVSLGNIVEAYDKSSGPGMLQEFAHDEEEIELSKKHGGIAGKLHTALHEVLGHASGQLEPGVPTPKETLKNYYSTIEEGRADLVALYFMLDPKLVELGLVETLDVGKAEYDGYIRNGLLTQLRRIEPGENIEESHMRNRMWVSAWAYEKGEEDSVIVKVERDGKLYYDIRDYDKLRSLFGELLKEVQRIKSQGDFEAAASLVENYGVKVDQAVHQQVLDRSGKLNIAPYGGFINPLLIPETDNEGNITSIKVEYPEDFTEQMLFYAKNYSFLSEEN